MGRLTERLYRINDEITALRRDEHVAFEELIMLGHLVDDARRDAAVSGNPLDARDARESARDRERMQRYVEDLRAAREALERKRERLAARLGASVAE